MLDFFCALFASLALASADFLWFKTGRDCNQCVGSQIITFTEPTSNADALKFFQLSLDDCAFPAEYYTLAIIKKGCIIRGSLEVCTSYEYDLRFWRYCTKGTSVNVDRGARCLNGICSKSDVRKLTCDKAVVCHHLCPKNCG